MFLAYFDESGDDGYPIYSSELFILSSIYMHHSLWQNNYNLIHKFRQYLKATYGMPVKQEFHTKEFLTGKSPYNGQYDLAQRREILFRYCQLISSLDIKIISVAIDKKKINRPAYDVLKNAVTYNVQRIENDLRRLSADYKFLIITDEGRVGKMRKTTREIQQINFIPSMYNPDAYRKEIKRLIEDPLPKNSKESYFIQITDLVAFVVSLYVKRNLCKPVIAWGNRIHAVLDYGDEILLMNALKSKMNTKASRSNEYGVVYYPK